MCFREHSFLAPSDWFTLVEGNYYAANFQDLSIFRSVNTAVNSGS